MTQTSAIGNLGTIAPRLALASLALVAAMSTLATSVSAQVIVIQSTAANLKAGTAIPNGSTIKIPAGKNAMFVLPSGATRTVSGPFSGKASDLTKGVKANPGLMAAVKTYVRTGGSNQKSVGAMRSAAPASFGGPAPFSWHALPVSANGDYCLEKGAKVTITRSDASKDGKVTIIDLKSKQRTSIIFKAGTKSAAWPDDLELDPRATYAVLMAGRPMRKLRVRMISPLPSKADTLQVLHGQRCESQFRAFIAELQASAG